MVDFLHIVIDAHNTHENIIKIYLYLCVSLIIHLCSKSHAHVRRIVNHNLENEIASVQHAWKYYGDL
jgi:hypothetical protein